MNLTLETFDQIRAAVHDLCGIVIAPEKHYLVTSRLEPILKKNALPSYEALLQGLKGPNAFSLQEQVIDAITTKETSFNRDGHPFEELRRSILPELAARVLAQRAESRLFPPRVRIWCTSVATGQEAYSVAMGVSDFLALRPGIGLTLDHFPILATDICQSALSVARDGRYSTLEVNRGLTTEQRDRYFHANGQGWVANDPLRRMIECRQLNLIEPLPNLGAFDLILCRNFLIYLDEAARRRLCQNLYQALNPRGILMIGAAESIYGVTEAFTTERLGNTFIHRKP